MYDFGHALSLHYSSYSIATLLPLSKQIQYPHIININETDKKMRNEQTELPQWNG